MPETIVKELLGFGGMALAGLVAFFNLRGRVGVIEARQKDDREASKRAYERIEGALGRIETKMDRKADK